MAHIRIHIALRALPVTTVAGEVAAHVGLDCFETNCSTSPRDNTAPHRRHFGGNATKH